MLPFLDTNVFLRHLTQDDAEFSPRATAYLERIEFDGLRVQTAATVIFEVVFTLQGKVYRQTREMIRDAFLPLIELPGIVLPGKQYVRDAFALYVDLRLPFADAYHAVIVIRDDLGGIVTFDTDFDRIPGIQRIEP